MKIPSTTQQSNKKQKQNEKNRNDQESRVS